MTLGELIINSRMMDSAECGNPIDLLICTECETETWLSCTVACPLLYYLKDIQVSSFEPSADKPGTMEIWLKGYKGEGQRGEYWDTLT